MSNDNCSHHTDVDGQSDETRPPADKVTDQVNLLLRSGLRPEADTLDEEGPVDGVACVRMRSYETCVVLKHKELELKEF